MKIKTKKINKQKFIITTIAIALMLAMTIALVPNMQQNAFAKEVGIPDIENKDFLNSLDSYQTAFEESKKELSEYQLTWTHTKIRVKAGSGYVCNIKTEFPFYAIDEAKKIGQIAFSVEEISKKIGIPENLIYKNISVYAHGTYYNNSCSGRGIDKTVTGIGTHNLDSSYSNSETFGKITISQSNEIMKISFDYKENHNAKINNAISKFELILNYDLPAIEPEIHNDSEFLYDTYKYEDMMQKSRLNPTGAFNPNSWLDWLTVYEFEYKEDSNPYTAGSNVVDWDNASVWQAIGSDLGINDLPTKFMTKRELWEEEASKYLDNPFNVTNQNIRLEQSIYGVDPQVRKFVYSHFNSYQTAKDKYDDLCIKGLARKKTIKCCFNINVKGVEETQRKIIVPLNFYKDNTGNEDNRYYKLIIANTDIDILLNNSHLFIEDLKINLGGINTEFETNDNITHRFVTKVAENHEIIVNERLNFLLPIATEIVDEEIDEDFILNINTIVKADDRYKNDRGYEKIDKSQITNAVRCKYCNIYIDTTSLCRNANSSDISAEEKHYNLVYTLPWSVITQGHFENLIDRLNADYGNYLKYTGLSFNRDAIESIKFPCTLEHRTNDLYLQTTADKSLICLKNGSDEKGVIAKKGQTLDNWEEILPKDFKFRGKEYDVKGWTQDKVTYPWQQGYNADITYNLIDFNTFKFEDSKYNINAVLELKQIEFEDKEDDVLDDTGKKVFEKGDGLLERMNDKIGSWFKGNYEDLENSVKRVIKIIEITLITALCLLCLWLIIWIIVKIVAVVKKH